MSAREIPAGPRRRHILFEGGRPTKDGGTVLDCERPDVYVFGHTHQLQSEWFVRTLLFNPGSAGPKRFALPRMIGLLLVSSHDIVPRHVSLPTRPIRRSLRP